MGGYRCGMSCMQKLVECVSFRSENFFVKCLFIYIYTFFFLGGRWEGGKVKKREERWEGSLLFTKYKKSL